MNMKKWTDMGEGGGVRHCQFLDTYRFCYSHSFVDLFPAPPCSIRLDSRQHSTHADLIYLVPEKTQTESKVESMMQDKQMSKILE